MILFRAGGKKSRGLLGQTVGVGTKGLNEVLLCSVLFFERLPFISVQEGFGKDKGKKIPCSVCVQARVFNDCGSKYITKAWSLRKGLNLHLKRMDKGQRWPNGIRLLGLL